MFTAEQKFLKVFLPVICIGASVFYLYTGYTGLLTPMIQMAPLAMVAMVIVVFRKPLKPGKVWARIIDYVVVVVIIYCCTYVMLYEGKLGFIGSYRAHGWDLVVGVVFLLTVLDATRRAMGWALVGVIVAFTLYAFLGNFIPGVFHQPKMIFHHFMETVSLGERGFWFIPMRVVATVVIYYIIFAAFLQNLGGAKFMVGLCQALLGKFRGGSAKVAVGASCLMGMINGSSVANVATTGVITIPLMKETGYKGHKAAAIETLASTGGQFMPPLMGTTAFVLAEVIGWTYWEVCIAAFIPAFIYYIALFFLVDSEAVRTNLKGLSPQQLPKIRDVFREGWVFIPPFAILVYLLAVAHMSPRASVLWALITLVVFSFFSRATMPTWRKIYDSLYKGIEGLADAVIACGAAGLLVGIIYYTGFGVIVSSALVSLAHGSVAILLILCALTSIILGMGMTTTAVYLFLAVVVAPAIVQMGVPIIAAHLFILYYGVYSGITPPVCTTSFVAAAVANEPPMKVGWAAAKWGIFAYLIPFIFVFKPGVLLIGSLGEIVTTTIFCII